MLDIPSNEEPELQQIFNQQVADALEIIRLALVEACNQPDYASFVSYLKQELTK